MSIFRKGEVRLCGFYWVVVTVLFLKRVSWKWEMQWSTFDARGQQVHQRLPAWVKKKKNAPPPNRKSPRRVRKPKLLTASNVIELPGKVDSRTVSPSFVLFISPLLPKASLKPSVFVLQLENHRASVKINSFISNCRHGCCSQGVLSQDFGSHRGVAAR